MAIEDNSADAIRKATDHMLENGYTEKEIKNEINKKTKTKYLEADSNGRVKLRDAMQKAYKAIGFTAEDADKTIEGWKKEGGNSSRRDISRHMASAGMSDVSFAKASDKMPKRPATDKDWDRYMDELDEYWQRYDFSKNDPVGRYGKGTIDMNNRKVIHNEDGSISTERSFSFYDEDTGKEILIPLIVNGKVLTEEQAIDHYYETEAKGKPEYLGMFDDWRDADEYAVMLHNRGDWYYHK